MLIGYMCFDVIRAERLSGPCCEQKFAILPLLSEFNQHLVDPSAEIDAPNGCGRFGGLQSTTPDRFTNEDRASDTVPR